MIKAIKVRKIGQNLAAPSSGKSDLKFAAGHALAKRPKSQ